MGRAAAIPPTLAFVRWAAQNGATVFFITGRPELYRAATERNLRQVGYSDFTALYMPSGRMGAQTTAAFKSAIRAEIIARGYVIVANIGDQESDLAGGNAMRNFLLPNPLYKIP
jgi:acid phosphatase